MKVSVIIPAYNSSKTILNTLLSVKKQNYDKIEVIVIDDGSLDNTAAIVEQFAEQNGDLNIVLIKKKNEGVSIARNIGLKRATGDLIAFLDSDDEWLEDKLKKQVKILEENKDIDLLGTCRNGEIKSAFLENELIEILFKQLLLKMYFITPTVIFRKYLLQEIGYFNEKKKFCEDADFFLRIAFEKKCFLLNESLVITGGGKAHFGESGLSSNLLEMEKGELQNFVDLRSKKQISSIVYVYISIFSLLKYLRRIFIVKCSYIKEKFQS